MDQPEQWKSETSSASASESGERPVRQAQPAAAANGPASPDAPHSPSARWSKELTEWIKALVIAGILVFVIRWWVVSPFIVDGPSMEPNFWNGERIIVNKLLYDIREPKRGEVIVFHVPDEGRDFIKRVIGVPGDTVKVDGDTVYINGKPIDEPYLKEALQEAHAKGSLYNTRSEDSDFPNELFPDGKVPKGMLFVMGDHRNNSKDSRMIGFIPLSRVVGRAELIFWPIDKIRYVGRGY
jgi:signal peptidase I